jgi:hypothetical protein
MTIHVELPTRGAINLPRLATAQHHLRVLAARGYSASSIAAALLGCTPMGSPGYWAPGSNYGTVSSNSPAGRESTATADRGGQGSNAASDRADRSTASRSDRADRGSQDRSDRSSRSDRDNSSTASQDASGGSGQPGAARAHRLLAVPLRATQGQPRPGARVHLPTATARAALAVTAHPRTAPTAGPMLRAIAARPTAPMRVALTATTPVPTAPTRRPTTQAATRPTAIITSNPAAASASRRRRSAIMSSIAFRASDGLGLDDH